ncbi:hypothetical protein WJX73_008794 [Symbiochloris irregularis]|uniref:Rubisco LSMT substrate-binding domain-containing protein n=1 Tax=Symbiochloris irregularis TaxID=706552 RepID=A0AAW1NYG3_9CHLO
MSEQSFLQWSQAAGLDSSKLSIRAEDGNQRGVFSASDTQPGRVLEVPVKALLTASRLHVGGSEHSEAVRALLPEQKLALFLLQEKSKLNASAWEPYLAQLPSTPNRLCTFNAEEIGFLQVRYAKDVATESTELVRQQWLACQHLMATAGIKPELQGIESWQWAAAMVTSRTMHFPAGGSCGALVPLGDMFNHAPGPAPTTPFIEGFLDKCPPGQDHAGRPQNNIGTASSDSASGWGTGYYDEDRQMYCIHTEGRYCKGDEMFLTYGQHTNLQLLELYGFLLDHNPDDRAQLPLVAFNLPTLAEHVQPGDAWLHWNGVPSWKLLQGLRLATASKKERRQRAHAVVAGRTVGPEAETRALTSLHAACTAILDVLPTTLQQDLQLLEDGAEPSSRMALALRWRIGYKRMVAHAAAGASRALQASQPSQGKH